MSITFLLPLFMQDLLGFTATQSGLALMPRTLVMMVGMPIIGRLYNKISPRLTTLAGMCLMVVAAFMMSHYTLDTTAGGVVNALLVQGVAFSFMMVPLSTVALSTIPRHRMTDATGLNSLLRQIGGSVGLAVFATLLSRSQVQAKAALATHVTATSPDALARLQMMTGAMLQRGFDHATAQLAAAKMMALTVMRQAMLLSFEHVFLWAGICFVLILPLVYFLKQPDLDFDPEHKPEMHVEL
jgi:DHA2 family multidrug resistance protein